MAIQLETVVPFGRSLDEYLNLFNLTAADLGKRILGVGDGPASFNAEAMQLGYTVTSIDPIYQFSGAEIWNRFHAVVDHIINQVRASPNDWVWSYHRSPDDLRQSRIRTTQIFIDDYDAGKAAGRYVVGELPHLPFADQSYDLALCSHFLFLYSEHLDRDFHLHSIRELLRVSREVRIFPLLTLSLQRSPHLDFILSSLNDEGYRASIQTVSYELQKNGNQMLVITQPGQS